MHPQNAFNLITKITDEKELALRKILNTVQQDVELNTYFPFSKLPSIHFARFVILDKQDTPGHPKFPAYLVLSTNYDGDLDSHLNEIVNVTKTNNGFDTIFSCCEKFPKGNKITDQERITFLKTDSHYHPYFYRGTWGRTVSLINAENEARNAIQQFLNNSPAKAFSQPEMKSQIIEHLKKIEALPSHQASKPPTSESFVGSIFILAALFLYAFFYDLYLIGAMAFGLDSTINVLHIPFLIIGNLLLFFVLVFVSILLYHEMRDKEIDILYDPNEETPSMKENEDHIVQNQLTHLVEIKPGAFRLFALKLVLNLVETAGIYFFNKGKLGSIPTIHFARWIIIDGGKRLLFFSNYDGSWENYLGDFIDKAAVGLTGIWSNTVEFPKTRLLFFKGALDEQRFKSWTRKYQIPTQVWYSAHKLLTVVNINNNTAIHEGLRKDLDEKQLTEWLLKL
jgi:hypothetical protein